MFLQLTTEFQNTQAKPQGETYPPSDATAPCLNSRTRSSQVRGAFTKADTKQVSVKLKGFKHVLRRQWNSITNK